MEVRVINILLQWVKDMGRRRAGIQIGLSLAPQLSPFLFCAVTYELCSSSRSGEFCPLRISPYPLLKDRVCY